jgi:hypothetical protein
MSREHCGKAIGSDCDFASSGFKKPGSPAPAISTPAIPNRVRKAGCRVRADADGLVEKSFVRSAHLAGKEGSLTSSLAPCGQLGRIYMRLSPEDGHPSYFPAWQQQRSIDNPRAGCRVRHYPTQHGACTINDSLKPRGGSALAEPPRVKPRRRPNALNWGRKGYPGVAL